MISTKPLSITNPPIDGLTGLRGIAALWGMLHHCWGEALTVGSKSILMISVWAWHVELTPLFKGGMGVEILFVLSGFLLFRSFAQRLLDQEKPCSLNAYFTRRVLRILPAYYAQMAVLMLLAMLGLYGTMPSPTDLLAHLLMIHNFSPDWTASINGVYWTLPIEFSFYLLLPLLSLIIWRTGWTVFVVGVITIVLAYKWMVYPFIIGKHVGYKAWLFGQLPGKLDLFVCGMVAAFLYEKHHRVIGAWRRKDMLEWLLIPSVISGIIFMAYSIHSLGTETYWNGHWSLFVWESILGCFIMLLVLGITLGGRLTRILFANCVLLFIGTISYSIYLWHYVLLKLLFEDSFIKRYISGYDHYEKLAVICGILVPVTLIVSALSYRYIEYPFLNFASRKRRFFVPFNEHALVKA